VAIEPCNGNYGSIDELKNAAGSIPAYCMNEYIIKAQGKSLKKSLSNYRQIIDHGYDGKFNTYELYIKDLLPLQIIEYMEKHGDDHFVCNKKTNVVCCKECRSAQACQNGCDNSRDCRGGEKEIRIPCPKVIYDPSTLQSVDEITYVCRDQDAFFNDIQKNYGIHRPWVGLGDHLAKINPGCEGSPNRCTSNIYWHGFPVPTNFKVPNPKQVIQNALKNLTMLRNTLFDVSQSIHFDLLVEDQSLIVDGTAIPVAMTGLAVQSMDKVSEIAKRVKREELKEGILAFITSISMLLPAVGEELAGVDLSMMGSLAKWGGNLGNGGLTIYGIVQDPKSAVFALFGMLYGLGKDEAALEEAGRWRRKMGDDDLKPLGPAVVQETKKISSIERFCI
jgi:chitinase